MRANVDATFIYDKNKGLVGSKEIKPVETKLSCNLTELGAEKSNLIIGNLKDETKVLRTLVPYRDEITYIVINDKRFNITKRVNYDRTTTLYITKQKG